MLKGNKIHHFLYVPAQSVANLVHIRGLLELVVGQRQEDSDAILDLQIVRKVRANFVSSCSYPLNSQKERCSKSRREAIHLSPAFLKDHRDDRQGITLLRQK
jgi:hypothetical protein